MAATPELTFRVDEVAKDLDREIAKREEANKYMHRMVEDVQARYRDISVSFGRIEISFTEHLKDDKQMALGISEMDKRMRTIERLTWIAVGGVMVIGGMVAIFGSVIMRYLK